MTVGIFAGGLLAADPVATDDGRTAYKIQVSGGGGGGGGDASAANQTSTQALPGSDATKATAVQGVTNGKPVPVSVADGVDLTQGAKGDAAYTGSGSASVVALLKGLFAAQVGTLKVQSTTLTPTAGTNFSGTVTTTSGGFNLPALSTRKPGDVQGQNLSAVNIGFNEFGGTAAIGTAGTYTVAPGGTFAITTNLQVNFIAASGSAAVTITSL